MTPRRHPHHPTFYFASILMAALFTSSCSRPNSALVERAPAYQPTPNASAPQIKLPSLVAPKLSEVREAVHRVFKDCAIIDESINPNFFTGDFNGDASQDLAVILKPAPGKLDEINQEYPAWLLRDLFLNKREDKPALKIAEREILLAIIHGYGDNDWRDSQATQTFLLKNAVGSNITVQVAQDFVKAHSGRKLPRPQGDLIGQTLNGRNGYVYYASANYSWYDPKTFKPRTDLGMVHGGR